MNTRSISRLLACATLLAVAVNTQAAQQVAEDPRFCGEPVRTANGAIKRSDSVTRRFQYLYPCPSTGRQVGACPGWAKDHVIPLSEGGCDAVGNMQWMPEVIKTCSGDMCKDRWERRVYKRTLQ